MFEVSFDFGPGDDSVSDERDMIFCRDIDMFVEFFHQFQLIIFID